MKYNEIEHPIVVQFRGSDIERMKRATILSKSMGYNEVNINCGCPALKNKSKEPFGAVLMKSPEKVRDICREMIKSCDIPVTVKCRIGVDDQDSYEALINFIKIVAESGVKHFIVHARKAILKGFSVIENRMIPPLRYDWVYKLTKDFPGLQFTINGGLKTIEDVFFLVKFNR